VRATPGACELRLPASTTMLITIRVQRRSEDSPTPVTKTFQALADALLPGRGGSVPVESIEIDGYTATGVRCIARLSLQPNGQLQIDYSRLVTS
jgi:hypothetical protein